MRADAQRDVAGRFRLGAARMGIALLGGGHSEFAHGETAWY